MPSLTRNLSSLSIGKNLAERLNVTRETLANWRNKGLGPAFVKLTEGRRGHVRYRLADVMAWEESLTRHSQMVTQNAEALEMSPAEAKNWGADHGVIDCTETGRGYPVTAVIL